MRSFLLLFVILISKISWAVSLSPALESSIEQAFRGQQMAISEADFQHMEREFEISLERDPDLVREAPAFAAVIANLYLKAQRVQEAIWILDRGGLYAEAEYLAQRYEAFLRTAEIIEVYAVGEGISQAKLVTFANGLQAILKPVDPQYSASIEGDVWTYQFDRMVGFNRTATAIRRTIHGIEYSLHGFVPNTLPTGVDMKSAVGLIYPDVYLLDYLILNMDRHQLNSRLTSGGWVMAIDHGRIGAQAVAQNVEWYENFDLRARPSSRILQSLMSLLNRQVFVELCGRYAPKLDMSFVLERIRALRGVVSYRYSYAANRPIYSEFRLQSQAARQRLSVKLTDEDQERLEALEKKVLSRAKVLPSRGPRVRGAELSEANLSFWIDGLVALKAALSRADFEKVSELNRKSQIHPELTKIFASEFVEALNWYERVGDAVDVLRFKKYVLTQEDLLLDLISPRRWDSGDIHQKRYHLPFEKAFEDPAFEMKLVAKIHTLPKGQLKDLLLKKYRLEILNHRYPSLRPLMCRSAHRL